MPTSCRTTRSRFRGKGADTHRRRNDTTRSRDVAERRRKSRQQGLGEPGGGGRPVLWAIFAPLASISTHLCVSKCAHIEGHACDLRPWAGLQDYERVGTTDQQARTAHVLVWVGTVVGVVALLFTAWAFFWKTPAQQAESAESAAASASATGAAVPSPAATGSIWHAGWGPERDTFTSKHPASYAVLNSITDQSMVGDERNFVRVRIAGEGEYRDYIRVRPGDKIELSVYVANDAADNLDGPAATIHGLWADFYFPPAGTDTGLSVTLGGKNVAQVWDGATVLSDVPIALHPIAGSMYMHTNAGDWTIDMGDKLDLVILGWDKQDGEFPVGRSSDGRYRGNGFLQVQMNVVAAG